MKNLLLAFFCAVLLANISQAQTISTVAGKGIAGYAGDGGPATSGQINTAYKIVLDKAGNLYIADYLNHRVRKVSASGIITTVAGNGSGGYSGDGGPATSAQLYYPEGVAVDSSGNLYIADAGNMVIRKVGVNGIITTFAGNHTGGYNGDNIPATSAELWEPNGVFVDVKTGNVIISDTKNNRIRKVTPNGIITTIAGTGAQGYGGDGGAATNASFYYPGDIAMDKTGNIYVADYLNFRIRKIALNGIITTFAGTGMQGFNGDGQPATSASLNVPSGVAVDAAGNIYIADMFNYRVRKIGLDGNISTVAGTGTAGYNGDGILATAAQLNGPIAVAFDAGGSLYISDRENERIRKVVYAQPPTITSFSPTSGGAGYFVTIYGTNFTGATAVSFGGVAASSFTVNSATKITAKVATGASGAVNVTTPGGTATKDGFVYCLTPSIKITANVSSSICQGTLVTFTATPTNSGTAPIYQWQKNKVNVGANSKTYIDSNLQSTDTIRCLLTSNASPCVTGANIPSNVLAFTVIPQVTPSVTITASPGLLVCTGTNVAFTATPVNGGPSPTYQWFKNGIKTGANNPAYTDSLAKDGDSVSVKLTSNAACLTAPIANSNVAKIVVNTPNPVISITANKDTSICASTAVTFTAVVKPVYLWKKDGVVVGNSSNIYKDSLLKNGDFVQCFLVSSSAGCNSNSANVLNSNKLKFAVKSAPAKPAAITGPDNVKVGQQGVYFSVPAIAGVIYYSWTLPSGALIDSGQGSYKIKVNWGSIGGTVSVVESNSCGTSPASTKTVGVVPAFAGAAKNSDTYNSIAISNDVKLYPNPAGAFATIQFTSKASAKYIITVTDAQDKVLEIKTGISLKGSNTVKINTGKYAKGAYFVTLSDSERGKITKPLIVGETK